LLRLARQRGVLTSHEAGRAGIHSQLLSRLVREGALERIARGQYRLLEQPLTEHHGLAVAARAVVLRRNSIAGNLTRLKQARQAMA
jgi:predicted transcriptional regulator of viral defense system